MNQLLIDHIDNKIHQACRFVTTYMPLDINTDNAYEAMLACSSNSTPAMITAFQNAAKYLPPIANHKTFNMSLGDGRVASIQVRFLPTAKWPAFLIPEGNLAINPEGYFAHLLETPIRVAAEWEALAYLWTELRSGSYDLEPYVLAYLFPWIRECLADFDIMSVPVDTSRLERKAIGKELSQIMNDWNITFFPRMSKQLTAIARSGRHLFAQFQMIEAAYHHEQLQQSPVTIVRTPSLIAPWIREHAQEAREEWRSDCAERANRQMEETMTKASKKFDKLNPKGN
jgi:hypothetical protein